MGTQALETLENSKGTWTLGNSRHLGHGYSGTWILAHSKKTWALEAIEALYLADSKQSNLIS